MQAPARAAGPPSAHGVAGFIVGFEEIGGRDDAELLALPATTEGRLAGHRLAAGVVGPVGQLAVGPVGHHAEHGRIDFHLAGCLVRPAQNGRHIAGLRLGREVELRRADIEASFNLLFAARGMVGAQTML